MEEESFVGRKTYCLVVVVVVEVVGCAGSDPCAKIISTRREAGKKRV